MYMTPAQLRKPYVRCRKWPNAAGESIELFISKDILKYYTSPISETTRQYHCIVTRQYHCKNRSSVWFRMLVNHQDWQETCRVFPQWALTKNCRIYWWSKVSNIDLYNKTDDQSVFHEIKRRWLDHVLKIPQNRLSKVALCRTLTARRKPGWPKTTWRRTAWVGINMGCSAKFCPWQVNVKKVCCSLKSLVGWENRYR